MNRIVNPVSAYVSAGCIGAEAFILVSFDHLDIINFVWQPFQSQRSRTCLKISLNVKPVALKQLDKFCKHFIDIALAVCINV